jgi:hypothetical protein
MPHGQPGKGASHSFTLLKKVTVVGEAEYPGTYAIQFEGERLSSLLKRVGGFKPTAYVDGVRFLRKIGTGGISRPSPEIVETQQMDTLSAKYGISIRPRLASNEVPINIAEMARDLIRLHGFEPDRDIAIEYIGLRPEGYVSLVGDPSRVEVITVDPESAPVAGTDVKLTVNRIMKNDHKESSNFFHFYTSCPIRFFIHC